MVCAECDSSVVKGGSMKDESQKEIYENGRAIGLSENAVCVLMSRYLKKGPDGKCFETPEELFRRVAKTIASAEKAHGKTAAEIMTIEQEFYDMMVGGKFKQGRKVIPCRMTQRS